MKSSRLRFQEFRDKIRRGVLDRDRYRDPNDKREIPNSGGRHGSKGGVEGKYELKHDKRRLLAEYRVMLKGFYAPLVSLLLLSLIGAFLTPVAPVALRIVADYIAKGKALSDITLLSRFKDILPTTAMASLSVIGTVLVLTAITAIALDWLRLLAFQRLNYLLAGALRQRLHKHISRLSLSQIADYKTGGIVSRIMGDSDQVVGGVQNAIITPFSAMVRVTLTLSIIIFTDWRLALGAAIFIPPVIAIHFFLFRRLRPLWRNIRDDHSILSARLTDMYGGIRVVRSFRRERSEQKEFGGAQNTMIRKQQHTAVLGRLLNTGWNTFGPAIGIVIVWYGGYLLISGKTTIGTLLMFQGLIFQLIGPTTQMIESFQHLQQNLGALDRVVDVLNQPTDMPDAPDAKAISPDTARGEIEFRGVTFGYVPEKDILHDVSLHIPAGTMLAIVGPSGSGKTTLINLVARFFDVKSEGHGGIFLDGTDIRKIRREDYRGLFAMVLQDVYLFDGTVADNIAYGRRHATREEIMAAAKLANAHDFIMEMTDGGGYDTYIGERGNKLSGGQKQRISIARAILADPRILILDEATSSLDTHSEHLIQNSLRTLMENRTTLVIAHRLSTIMHADRIVVLVDGQVVEQGTHDELLERRGTYYTMFTQQFERHRDPALERIDWQTPEEMVEGKTG